MWFRQDLRVVDNTALVQACADSDEVIPVFIFDPAILARGPEQDPRVGFLVDAIRKLEHDFQTRGSKLYVMYGDSVELMSDLVSKFDIDCVFANRSYGW
jgi:deoxyribodipyrimidine photo-lyase